MFSHASRVRLRFPRAGFVALCAASLSIATTAAAQQVDPPRSNTLFTTVGGVFTFNPALPALTQNAQTGTLCSPGACYVGGLTALGNRGWQLQVKLLSVPETFTVAHVQTAVPASAQAVNTGQQTWLNTSTWLTIATSTTSSAGTAVSVMFNARKGQGKNGIQPSGSQVAAVVMYRVIAYP